MAREMIHRPITTLDEAKAFVQFLQDEGLMFHFEDDVHDIIWGGSSEAPTHEELVQMDLRRDELYGFEWGEFECPIGYALHVMGHSSED